MEPPYRRIERKDLIMLFNALQPGEEITTTEIYSRTGLDISKTGDRNLCWQVREHCRDVLGFCVEYTKEGNMRRETDIGIVTGLLARRRKRIYGQIKRGVSETLAITDFDALPRDAQKTLLAHQSTLQTMAMASQPGAIENLRKSFLGDQMQIIPPEDVLAAAKRLDP
jgi:hypothetical protein